MTILLRNTKSAFEFDPRTAPTFFGGGDGQAVSKVNEIVGHGIPDRFKARILDVAVRLHAFRL